MSCLPPMFPAPCSATNDLVVVVVARAKHRHVAGDAAFAEGDIFGSVEGVRLPALRPD